MKVFLADDHTMVREGLAALIGKHPQIEIVGQCGDGLQVVESVGLTQPDVVVLDITMPGLNGLDICRELTRKHRRIAVLILTMHESQQFIVKAVEHGARGYVLKDAPPAQLVKAILAAAKGEVSLGPGISNMLLDRINQGDHDPYDGLTSRERQVLQLIAESKTNREIAKQLGLSIKTVDTHRSHLMRKLGIHDQTSLVKYALRRGIVPLT